MPQWGKVTGEWEVLSGFLSGILMTGGLVVWAGPDFFWSALGPVCIAIGIISLFDDTFPFGRQPHLMSELGGFFAGIIAVTISAMFIAGSIYWLLAIVLILVLIKLLIKVVRKIL